MKINNLNNDLYLELSDKEAEKVLGGRCEVGEFGICLVNENADLPDKFYSGDFKLLPNGNYVAIPDGGTRF